MLSELRMLANFDCLAGLGREPFLQCRGPPRLEIVHGDECLGCYEAAEERRSRKKSSGVCVQQPGAG